MKTIPELQKEVFENATAKGFHKKTPELGTMLALIHSEVSEALEADRVSRWTKDCNVLTKTNALDDDGIFQIYFKNHIKDRFEDEMADIVIRVMDLCGKYNINLYAHIIAKMRYNSLREPMHGKNY